MSINFFEHEFQLIELHLNSSHSINITHTHLDGLHLNLTEVLGILGQVATIVETIEEIVHP